MAKSLMVGNPVSIDTVRVVVGCGAIGHDDTDDSEGE